MSKQGLTHVDASTQRPTMVDVGDKPVTERRAHARARVRFPPAVARQLRDDALRVAKGAVIDTAIIAGTMALKRTHELIPFCHPLPLEACRISIDWEDDCALRIDCEARATYRTGIEMEALTGASVAALTVYDMCKALSHEIVIEQVALVSKRGGRRDVGE
ncbi:cyclic pyranopterin monophosphate synthase MoaC [Pseudomarimonas salicorniae]|uniref:Cyclic pyranopterin monophosphate synthase MoaC n=1 Tax=Pseudomarimonas salicorniae TaxID=2933270 RepID=A0ABT0GFD8_9GAMM|nr:cyclic pyranopterin monophosphate synthase MoaC [Lysobacter sp. CAU 1642]MCK7593257.1 cyclic pyranopterin monophosphate synthase MoaC [Lysobacter sp. CAU 1642]